MRSRGKVQAMAEGIKATAREESEEPVVNHSVDDDSVEQTSGLPSPGGPSGPQPGGAGAKGRVVTKPRGRRRSREQRIRRSAAPGNAVLKIPYSQRGSGVARARSLPAKSFFVASFKISRAGDHGRALSAGQALTAGGIARYGVRTLPDARPCQRPRLREEPPVGRRPLARMFINPRPLIMGPFTGGGSCPSAFTHCCT